MQNMEKSRFGETIREFYDLRRISIKKLPTIRVTNNNPNAQNFKEIV
jgi:hypothetical protein